MSFKGSNCIKHAAKQMFPAVVLAWRQVRDKYLRFKLRGRKSQEIFADYYRSNYWGNQYSVSGRGSSLRETATIRNELPGLLRKLECRSLLDVPCGDLHWIREIDLPGVRYFGADIVPDLIERNNRLYENEGRHFQVADITKDPLPEVDAILCRDCLIHLSNDLVEAALRNVARSTAKYLLSTTFVGGEANWDILTGAWRPIDLTKPPFNLPPPVHIIVEMPRYLAFGDKAIGVWPIEAVRRVAGV